MTSRPVTPTPTRALSRRGFLAGSGLAAGAVLLPACAPDTQGGDPGGDGSGPVFLSVYPVDTDLSFGAEVLGVSAGYFEDEGVTPQIEATRGSAPAIQTLLNGNAALSRLGQIELMVANAQRGASLVAIGTVLRGVSIYIMSAAENPLETPADFAGKTIGIPSEGGTSETLLDLMLTNAGIAVEDVPRQVVGLTPGTFDLVERGDVAGYMVSLDTSVILSQQRENAVVFDPNVAIASDGQHYVTTREILDERGDELRHYLAGAGRSIQELIDDPSGSLETIRQGPYSGIALLDDDALATSCLEAYVPLFEGDGSFPLLTLDTDAWAAGYDELVAGGVVPDGLDPTEWYDTEVAPS